MFKKLKYIKPVFVILSQIRNWPDVLSIFLFPRLIVVQLKKGYKFIINNFHNLVSLKEIFVNQEYFIKHIKPKYIVDIGANLGDSTIFFSSKYPKATIFAYEPSNSIFPFLISNLSINNITNVVTYKLGVGGRNKKITFYENNQSGLSSIYDNRSNTSKNTINIIPLSKVFSDNGISRCDLLKIDCEGAEYEILMKADKKTLFKIKNMVLEYHDNVTKHDHGDLITFLRRMGFKLKIKSHSIENNIGLIYASR